MTKLAAIEGPWSESVADVIAYFNYLEGGLCQKINRLSQRDWIRRFFSVISRAGDGGGWGIAGVAMIMMQGRPALGSIVQMIATCLVGIAIYKVLKNRLVRERPYINHGDILCGAAPLDRYSFPSGHTLHAVSFAIMISHFEPLLLPIVVPFALLGAASRVILGLHYPSDVIVGAAIGATLAVTSITLF
jgi:undecaprenyl-diphosphatase